jgi:hypothetical protein
MTDVGATIVGSIGGKWKKLAGENITITVARKRRGRRSKKIAPGETLSEIGRIAILFRLRAGDGSLPARVGQVSADPLFNLPYFSRKAILKL